MVKKFTGKEIRDILNSKDIAKKMTEQIQKSTRKGQFADGSGKLKPLKDSTIDWREFYQD